MDNIIFGVIMYVIVAMGLLSIAWTRNAMIKLTDDLIIKLFRCLIILTAITTVFAIWLLVSSVQPSNEVLYRFSIAIALVALFAAISRAALAAKGISDMYGFKAKEKKKNG